MKSHWFAHAIRVLALFVGCAALLNCGTNNTSLKTITVTPANATVAKGENLQLVATGVYSDGSTQVLTDSVTWQTNKSAIAAVSEQGQVTGMGEGAAQVSASYQQVTGSTYVTIGAPALVGISVTPTPSSLPVGESEQLTATGKFSDGTTQNLTQSVTWASSGTGIATVTPTGSVLGNALGTASITATSAALTGSASVTVGQAALVGITVTPNPSSVPLGESEQLTATAKFSDGSTQNVTQSVTWASSGTGIATVNSAGSVLATGGGTANITATMGTTNGTASVTVGQAALIGITITPSQSSLPIGESEQLAATGNFSDGSVQNLTQAVLWSSSGSAIASVSSAGSVVANALGSATINATAGAVTGSAGLTVTPAVVVSLNIVPATFSFVLGNTSQLQASAAWSDGTVSNVTASAAWSATPASIASITSSGLATALQVGTTTIFGTYNGVTGTANATVLPLLFVNYFNRANAVASGIDGTLRLINPGTTRSATSDGGICAMIYVFDQTQELNECCGCPISSDGLLTLSLVNDLTANPLVGVYPTVGEIMVVSSDPTSNPQCDAGSLTPTGTVAGWETNDQANGDGTFSVTETPFDSVPLNSVIQTDLPALCGFIETLGSGAGICTCGSGDSAAKRSSRRK